MQELLRISEKSQSSCFFHEGVMQLLQITTLNTFHTHGYKSIPSSLLYNAPEIPVVSAKRFKTPSQLSKFLICISDRQKIIDEEMAWFPIRCLCLPLTLLKKRTENLSIPLGRIFASRTMLPLFSFCSGSLYSSILLSFCKPVFLPFSLL